VRKQGIERIVGWKRILAAVIIIAFTGCLLYGGGWTAAVLAVQPGPTWMRLATTFTASGIGLTLALLIGTLVFGRFFCSVFCPLGIAQDMLALARRKTRACVPNVRMLRYALAALAIGFLVGGSTLVFRIFDPYTRYSAIVASIRSIVADLTAGRSTSESMPLILAGLFPLVILVAVALWKRRIYCVSVCPVGAVLGLLSRFSLFRICMKENCTGCGVCERRCPTGCIDSKAGVIDSERCVLCLQCLLRCHNGSIGYGRKRQVTAPADSLVISRRQFLVKSVVVALGVTALGAGLRGVIQSVASATEPVRGRIVPPGGDPAIFPRKCTGCQACVASCPAGIIKRSATGFGPVGLDYTENGCQYNCTACNTVCPTGALRPLKLREKQRTKIGAAAANPPDCRNVKDGIPPCTLCEEICPRHAIMIVPGPDGQVRPEVLSRACIGCGLCRAVCPVVPKAIEIRPIA
jgi:ferredoxin-type protein NapF